MPRKKSEEVKAVTNEQIMEFLKALQEVVQKPSPEIQALRDEISAIKLQLAQTQQLEPTPAIKKIFEVGADINREVRAAQRRQQKELVPYTPNRTETVVCEGVFWKLKEGEETHVPPGVISQIKQSREAEVQGAKEAERLHNALDAAAAKLREITQ